jgi:hypothetical protein
LLARENNQNQNRAPATQRGILTVGASQIDRGQATG